jgi:imidazolonepropionase-like amidohydrolase
MAYEDLPAPTPFAPPADGEVVAYQNAAVIDLNGGAARTATIVVTGSTIREVAVNADVDVTDATVVDLAGRFVIPGLIDSHQHIATPPNRPVAEAALRRQVYGGVTAIRDMADDLRQIADLARAARIGEIPGPDIHFAALMAGPGFFDDPRTWQVSQGETPGHVPWMQAITEDTDLRVAVALARGTGAKAIKVYADLPANLVTAIVAEAKRQGIAVWAHAAVFPASPSEVVAAGVDVVSHASLLAQETADEPLTSYKTKAAIDLAAIARDGHPQLDVLYQVMRERGTILDATAGLYAWLAGQADDDEALARAQANGDVSARITADAYRAGVEVSAGTDYENDPADPFPSLYNELAFLVQRCGMTAEEALRSGTVVGAASMGTQDTMGTVEAGKLANFAVLADDPRTDIGHLRGVRLVVKRGHRFEREAY